MFDVLLAATSAQLGAGGDASDVDPLLLRAVADTNPSLSAFRWFELDNDAVQGAVNAAKGKYFEYLVVERLNNGEQVGPLMLESGQRAELAESFNQPGWDVRIVDDHGQVLDYLQMKATDSIGYVKNALERYPDIQILGTTEVAEGDFVIDSGMSNSELRDVVGHAVHSLDDSVTEMFLDYFSPLLPLAVIAGVEGYRMTVGNQSISDFKLTLARRGQRVVATQLAGAAVFAIGGGLLSLPAAVVGGLWYDRVFNQASIGRAFSTSCERLLSLRLYQQERLLGGAQL
ncbi:hypothetical protein U5817_17300 [Aromatoleum evansii]|uniref:Uncharacterized protein n=1 Tax=Aromatoleum evansii TaxID=59406 RepID=A0ABZ1AGE7_AROEV|nr:hypothetical protein U5817_17300 [Aromatoleum evansii]